MPPKKKYFILKFKLFMCIQIIPWGFICRILVNILKLNLSDLIYVYIYIYIYPINSILSDQHIIYTYIRDIHMFNSVSKIISCQIKLF